MVVAPLAKNITLNDPIPLSLLIFKKLNKKAQTRFLKEDYTPQSYSVLVTLDLIDESLNFNPIGYSNIQVYDPQSLPFDFEHIHWLEEAVSNQQIEMRIMSLDLDGTESKELLIQPVLSRHVDLYYQGKKVGEIHDFLSEEVNCSNSLSLVEYLHFHAQKEKGEHKIFEDLMYHIESIIEIDFKKILNQLFEDKLSLSELHTLQSEISSLDHVGFLCPLSSIPDIDKELSLTEFSTPSHFKSQILSKELGKKIGKEEVPTEIVKAYHEEKDKKIGAEIFVPKESHKTVSGWTSQGVGLHLAFKVKEKKSLPLIDKILRQHHIDHPSFMGDKPKINSWDETSTLYFEISSNKTHFSRVEFLYKKNEDSPP